MKLMRKLLLFVIICMQVPCFGQNNDLWQWTTISLDKKLTDKLSVGLDEEIRLYDNMSRLNLCYTNLGFSYKLNSHFKTALTYRFLQKKEDDGSFSFRHRIMFDVTFKYKVSKIIFSYRSRLQSQVRDVYSSEKGSVGEKYWRSKFDFKLDLDKPFVPYISAEFRYQFANARQEEANNSWNRGRYYIGFDYEVNDGNSLGAYYMIQKNYHVIDPETDFTIGVTYALDIDYLFNRSSEKKILRQ